MVPRRIAALLFVTSLLASPALAAASATSVPHPVPVATRPANPPKGTVTHLPLPRFVSLRSNDVNLRAGPGFQYPIKWVFRRRGLPVEVVREFDVWRLVKDPFGAEGWVHEATITGFRDFIVEGAERTMRRAPSSGAPVVARLMPGVIGRILHCAAGSDWCETKVDQHRGWLRRQDFWGSYAGEKVN
ncbi:MAG TPA: SH3 domain-containing protein [Acetobacteraceae bacterium]|nr:SH3 domain-containing protein [Acetobacteraceae bacterium]